MDGTTRGCIFVSGRRGNFAFSWVGSFYKKRGKCGGEQWSRTSKARKNRERKNGGGNGRSLGSGMIGSKKFLKKDVDWVCVREWRGGVHFPHLPPRRLTFNLTHLCFCCLIFSFLFACCVFFFSSFFFFTFLSCISALSFFARLFFCFVFLGWIYGCVFLSFFLFFWEFLQFFFLF